MNWNSERRIDHSNLILLVVVIGTLMASIDSTIVLLAFPAMVSSLRSSISTMIWVILIYMIVVAVSSTQLGRIGDIYGRSRIFNLGFAIFTASSFLCGIAPTDVSLIAFRGVQAIGGAMISSNSNAIIADTFPRNKIGRAYGFTAMSWNIGALLGILLGGVITTFIGYRYIFFINVPIGIIAVLLGILYIKDNQKINEPLDLIGMITLGTSVGFLSYAGINYAASGLSQLDIIMLFVGIILLPVFFFYEKMNPKPLLNLAMFKNKIFRNSLLASLFQGLGFMGVTFMIIMYLQGVRGLSPLNASLLLFPGYIVSAVLAPYMGRASDRIGSRTIATLGILFMFAGTIFYVLYLNFSSPLYYIIIGTVITGFGGGMFWPANNSAVMANVSSEFRGVASGTLRLLGSIGIVGSFVITFVAAASFIPRYLAFAIFAGTFTRSGSLNGAFVNGMHYAFLFLAVMLLLAGIFSFTRGKEERHKVLVSPQGSK